MKNDFYIPNIFEIQSTFIASISSPLTLAISKSEYYGSLFIYYICLSDKVNYFFIYYKEVHYGIFDLKNNNGSALVQSLGMHSQLFN